MHTFDLVRHILFLVRSNFQVGANLSSWEVEGLGRRRGVMSEQFKEVLAKDLGFYDTVQREGWSGIRAKDAGNMVKRAVQIAEQTLSQQSEPRR